MLHTEILESECTICLLEGQVMDEAACINHLQHRTGEHFLCNLPSSRWLRVAQEPGKPCIGHASQELDSCKLLGVRATTVYMASAWESAVLSIIKNEMWQRKDIWPEACWSYLDLDTKVYNDTDIIRKGKKVCITHGPRHLTHSQCHSGLHPHSKPTACFQKQQFSLWKTIPEQWRGMFKGWLEHASKIFWMAGPLHGGA